MAWGKLASRTPLDMMIRIPCWHLLPIIGIVYNWTRIPNSIVTWWCQSMNLALWINSYLNSSSRMQSHAPLKKNHPHGKTPLEDAWEILKDLLDVIIMCIKILHKFKAKHFNLNTVRGTSYILHSPLYETC